MRDIEETLVEDVIAAYHSVQDTLDPMEITPNLVDVYKDLLETILDNIAEEFFTVFGSDDIRDDWLRDMGIEPDDVPHILTVAQVLNDFKMGYIYKGIIYNFVQVKLLDDYTAVEDDF